MQPFEQAAGMRQAASQLLARADRLAEAIVRVDARVASMTYTGPAADRFRSVMADQRQQLITVRGHMQSAAHTLQQGAAVVERDAARLRPGR